MNLINIFLVALGVSTDAFAVAFASNHKVKNTIFNTLKKGIAFGIAETLMFILGWLISKKTSIMITNVDHWIAFALLGGIGIHMIYMGLKENEYEYENITKPKSSILTLIGSSVDSAAIGVTFAFLDVDILIASVIICATCSCMASIGIILSSKVKKHLGEYAEIVGGVVLILVGLFILIEHLTA